MNWQKLSNVNFPPNQVFMIWSKGWKGRRIVEFARRFTNESGDDSVEYSNYYSNLVNFPDDCWEDSYEAFKASRPNAYWCTFHEPE